MATLSGVVTVTTAGTAVPLGDVMVNGPLLISCPTSNTGNIFVGNVDGDVASTNGFELGKGYWVKLDWVGNIGDVIIDAANNGDKANWMAANFRKIA